jgi:hypothetical protein
VLVVFKPVPAVLDHAARAVIWMAARGIKAYVEPAAFASVRDAAAVLVDRGEHGGSVLRSSASGVGFNGNGGTEEGPKSASVEVGSTWINGGSPPPRPPANPTDPEVPGVGASADRAGPAAAPPTSSSAAGAGPHAAQKPLNLEGCLATWRAEEGCGGTAVPREVGEQLDLVLALGGDGTGAWWRWWCVCGGWGGGGGGVGMGGGGGGVCVGGGGVGV